MKEKKKLSQSTFVILCMGDVIIFATVRMTLRNFLSKLKIVEDEK